MAATAMKNLTAILAAAGSPLPPGYDSYPVEHFGVVPAPTTCFNQGPGQAHVSLPLRQTLKSYRLLISSSAVDEDSREELLQPYQ